MPDYPILHLRKKEERRLLAGHLWAFSNELVKVPKDITAGTIVRLARESDNFVIGQAFYHPNSLIAARIISRNPDEPIDETFFERQIASAAEKRRLLLTRRNAARLVHGESDLLPGLIVDRFNDIISFQITSAGFEIRKELLVSILKRLFRPKSIVEKNNSNLRKLEGLELIEKIADGTDTATEIHDASGTRYAIDVLKGQKTGFFLDQMENRSRLRDFVGTGDSVLDLFANEGGFGLNAALAGAARVVAVDQSREALEKVISNAKLNGVERALSVVETDVFKAGEELGGDYNVVILDPPALARGKKDIHNARHGYINLNIAAMKRVKAGGILLSASCSHHMTRELLLEVIQEASRRTRRTVTILEERGAGIDHPILLGMPETAYLKVFLLRVG